MNSQETPRFVAGLAVAARDALDRSAETVSDQALERLARARERALSAAAERGATVAAAAPPRWLPALAMAATVVIAIGGWQQTLPPPLPFAGDPLEATAAQHVELLDELEFLAWLELQDGAVEGVDHAG